MLFKRIIFLSQDQHSRYDHNRFGIDTLEKRGFTVEYWDCSKLFRTSFQKFQCVSDTDGFSGLRYFEEKNVLLESISRLTSRDVLITSIHLTTKTWSLLQQIANIKAVWGTLKLGDMPMPPGEKKSFLSLLEKLFRKPSRGINFILGKLPFTRLLGFRSLDFILNGGASPLPGNITRMKGTNTRILDVHSFDYDSHLRAVSNKEEDLPPAEIVFLDDGGPFHRDNILCNITFPCSVEEFYFNLNSFFNLVEKKFKCSVVVACHPRMYYEEKENPFEGRKIVRGETQKWIRSSNLVITFMSTAVSFAVIYKKPIVFLGLNPNKRNFFDPTITNIAAKLGKSPIYWNGKGNVNWDREFVVNQNYYDQYREIYLKKSGTAEKPCWEIFADYLESLSELD
jgi:hypothetical protein